MSSSGQRLQHVDLARLSHAVAQATAIAGPLAVDEHDHVLSQLALLVHDIVAHLRMRPEHLVESGTQRRARYQGFGALDVAREMRGEDDPRHGQESLSATSARRLPCAMHSARSSALTGRSSAVPAKWVAP